jgi:hypothetical protein
VRLEMERILSSPQFCNSKRYPGLLRYVVDQTLSGNGDHIKERTVGVDVFGRAPDYDTNADTVVRYTAGEVRKRLALYYVDAADAPIQITLSTRSYLPEFHRIVESDADAGTTTEAAPAAAAEPPAPVRVSLPDASAPRVSRRIWLKIAACLALILLGAFLFRAGRWIWADHLSQASNRFWSPITQAKGPVLICPGGVVFSPTSKIGTEVADSTTENPYLSFENGLAMGRVAALLNSKGADYRIQPSASTTLAQLRENPVVLVGAYNNAWTQRLLSPLRFHFGPRSEEAIIDALHPEAHWARDSSKPFAETPDYGLIARFRNPSTDSVVVVLAGLQRFGTDAASQFVVSPHMLEAFNRQVGADWADKNIEVVIRVDVVNGRAGAPIIEAAHVW